MAKPRSRDYHRAKGQVRRDALLHSRPRWLYYRSWAKQAGLHLRLVAKWIPGRGLAARPGRTTLATRKSTAIVVLAAARKAQRHRDAAMAYSLASPSTCAMKAVEGKILENASSRMLKPPV